MLSLGYLLLILLGANVSWEKLEERFAKKGCFDGSYIKVIGVRLRNSFIAHSSGRLGLASPIIVSLRRRPNLIRDPMLMERI